MIHIPSLYRSGPVVLQSLPDEYREEYSLKMGALRVEFSRAASQGKKFRLCSSEGFDQMTVKFGEEEGGITDSLKDVLERL